ncbi:polyprenol monophosphomannose synthase [Tsukamurella asaccharolytica]|uniref:dolichyl-phosphate beta-D-mannosyltransferase n=1 Tax=Tsukamurella asaccharolytica TaxID=2592067 RepID=A0A5C5RAJ2_9ACTN|nr:polyprenol monophosphomannose synthase [Tsukamurella asaccharolytica]TWS19838.1 polyprenol monophosphomannose synthase [Tsukamurella asaccharolytica]
MSETSAPSSKTLVIIPTYNELENLPLIVGRLHRAQPAVDVLVVDDNSPDGTGDLADSMAAEDPRIHVLHRAEKNGLGGAYIAGFTWALERDYRVIVEMDADGSHAPEQLERHLAAIDAGADLVIGSRYVSGGKTVNWPLSRQLISRGGNLYSQVMLGTRIRDITGGYKAFRREALEGLGLDEVESLGYSFQIDLTWRAVQAGFTVVEVPITFTERVIGDSKMSGSIFKEAATLVPKWGFQARKRKLQKRLST